MTGHQDHQDSRNQKDNSSFSQAQVMVVMVPLPAQGHLNQLFHLSCLILAYGIPVHFVGTAVHNCQVRLRSEGWDPNTINKIHFHDFTTSSCDSPAANANCKDKFLSHLLPQFCASSQLREPVAALLRSLSSKARRVIVINDSLMASVVQDITSIPNAESYTFHSVSAFTVLLYYLELIGKHIEIDSNILKDIPSNDGCFTPEFKDFIASQYAFQGFNSGKLFNTSKVIEGSHMDLLQRIGNKKHWALGPFSPAKVAEKKTLKQRHLTLEWLDKQAAQSVLYISFGTTSEMTDEQINELAIGLEKSNQKFIWVFRDSDKGDVFNGSEARKAGLPDGFEERLKETGMVVRDWAPQLEILAHPSTGGFISHCGWNSCTESITMGVPIAAWPMHSDQPRNTVLLTKLLKVGIVVKDWARRDELLTSSAVESAVRRLMTSKEGAEIRKRAGEIGEAVRRSMEEGGASRKELDSFVSHITR